MAIPPLHTLSHLFNDEDACTSFLFSHEIFYPLQQRPRCGSPMNLQLTQGVFQCPHHGCRAARSIRKGSFFASHKLPCSKILFMGYLWLTKTPSSAITAMTGHSKHTVANFLLYFRQLIASHLDEDDTRIGGPGIIVEVDEAVMHSHHIN